MVLFSGTIPLTAENNTLSLTETFKLFNVDFKNTEGTTKTI